MRRSSLTLSALAPLLAVVAAFSLSAAVRPARAQQAALANRSVITTTDGPAKRPIERDPAVISARSRVLSGTNFPEIWGGSEAKKNHDPYPDAVLLKGPGAICTGVLVSRTAIVTAGHCVCLDAVSNAYLGVDSSGFPLSIDSKRTKSLLNCDDFKRLNNAIPPAQQDVSILFLTSPVPFIPHSIATDAEFGADLQHTPDEAEIVGFGVIDDSGAQPDEHKRYATVPIASPRCDRTAAQNGSGETDAALYHCHAGLEMVTVTPATKLVGACSGDSGGPSYMVTNGAEPDLVAITSRIVSSQGCGFGSIQVLLVGQTRQWIASNVTDLPASLA